MGYTIITEENCKEILEKLVNLTKNRIYIYDVYEYGVNKKYKSIDEAIQKKDSLKYEVQWPHIWIYRGGEYFNDTLCGTVMSNADILDVEEHWLYKDYLKHKNPKESESNDCYEMGSSWLLTKPLIYMSLHKDQVLILSEGDRIKITENEINVLIAECDLSNELKYMKTYEFKYVTTITDEEAASLRASKKLYIDEWINKRI